MKGRKRRLQVEAKLDFDGSELTEETQDRMQHLFENAVETGVEMRLENELENHLKGMEDELSFVEKKHDQFREDIIDYIKEEIEAPYQASLKALKDGHEQLRKAMYMMADELSPEARARFYAKVGQLARDTAADRSNSGSSNYDAGIDDKQAEANRDSIRAGHGGSTQNAKPDFLVKTPKPALSLKEELALKHFEGTQGTGDRYAAAITELARRGKL